MCDTNFIKSYTLIAKPILLNLKLSLRTILPYPNKKILFRIILFTCFFKTLSLFGQNTIDTLNKFNSDNKKSGNWTFYLDSLFNRCEIVNAKYYGFIYYDNGIARTMPIAREDKSKTIYKPFSDSNFVKRPVLLNGEICYSYLNDSTQQCDLNDVYINGNHTIAVQNFNRKNELFPESDIFYFDSLYNNNATSFLFHKKDKNLILYKQYLNWTKSGNSSDRIYFVKHKDFKSINRPKIGGYFSPIQSVDKFLKTKFFLELGFSKNFISGTIIDTTGRTYYDNLAAFQSLNFSLQGSLANKTKCLAQKITYSYTFLMIRGEAGIINYTDFKKNDPRLTFGIGLTIVGYFNIMAQFLVPLTKNQFEDIPYLYYSGTIN